MNPAIRDKRDEARTLITAKIDAAHGAGRPGLARIWFGRIIRLDRGRYDHRLPELIAELKQEGDLDDVWTGSPAVRR